MACFERDYIEIKRETSIMKIVGIRREGVELSDLPKYNKAIKRGYALKSIGPFIFMLLIIGCLYLIYKMLTETEGGKAVWIIFGVLFVAAVIWLAISGVQILLDSRKMNPSVTDALDWKLKTEYKLCEMHDMVSVDSALAGNPAFLGSLVMPSLRDQHMREGTLLTQFAKEYVKTQQTTTESTQTATAAPATGSRVIDLRSETEKEIEQNSGNQLLPERETLAQEMFQYLKTHDTGNNPEHYREFRALFHERSEAIAESGGYHQALQEIYYRIRQLCKEQGVYFHSGGIDNVFKGDYWQS